MFGLVETFGVNMDKIYIGVVQNVARIEESAVLDKLGDQLKPFEIIFNSGDVLTNCRATPLVVSTEILEGDSVLVFSTDNLLSSTFFYLPIRNMDSPRDTLRFKYGETQIDFRPSEGSTDLLLSTGNTLITLNGEKGVVNIDGQDGISLDSKDGLVNIKNEKEDLSNLIGNLIEEIQNLKIILPNGEGFVAPQSVAKLISLNTRFEDLLGSTDESPYYPIENDDPYDPALIGPVARELGLDFFSDELPYVPGEDPVLDKIHKSFGEGSLPPPPSTVEPSQVLKGDDTPGDVRGLPVGCPVGPYKGEMQLTPNYTLASLTTKTTFPHKLKAQGGFSEGELVCNLKALATNVIEPIRLQYPNIKVNSSFRSYTKGVSQHEKGQAVDIQIPGLPSRGYIPVAEWIVKNIDFDQFIFEHGNTIWLHISYKREGKNRKDIKTMYKGKYTQGMKCYY